MSEEEIRITDDKVEVLEDPDVESLRASADLLARMLDTVVCIPGTNIRLGLDPLIGLIPGIGDALASLIGSTILLMGVQLRVPRIVLVRMGVNVALNGAIGAIPVFGDLFSIWFKSNVQNANLLRRASGRGRRRATAGDWLFVTGVLVSALLLVLGAIVGILWLVARIWELIQ